jgi:2-deoxy-D-gluconate 3-dehydrogenase
MTETLSATLPSLSDLIDLSGQVAIVTGAGRGLGFAIADRLSEAGAAVVINDIDGDAAAAAASALAQRGRTTAAVPGDVSRGDTVQAMLEAGSGFGRIGILVNNAAMFKWTPFAEITEEYWRRMMDVNLLGPLLAMQLVSRKMTEDGRGGCIINVSTGATTIVVPDELVAYAAAKSGLRQASRVIAKTLATHGIRVNQVVPGGMDTPGATLPTRSTGSPLDPERRMHPDQVARSVVFLASGLAEMVTGAEIHADGGMSLG